MLATEERVIDLTTPTFFAMIEAGLFPPDRRVFLWNGRICEKMAKTVAHAITAVAIGEALRPLLGRDWLLWPENPIQLDLRNAPLPDVTVVRGPLDVYARERRHPGPSDVGLIVEVGVSSLATDLTRRARKFARALVPAYWVVDVVGRRIVEHIDPQIVEGVGSYARVRSHGVGDEIPLSLDGREYGRLPVEPLITGIGLPSPAEGGA
jgi:Uma2 family endonuclease